MKKYELVPETKIDWLVHELCRIRALVSFTTSSGITVNVGDLGGFIEKENNLSHDNRAWVYGNAKVWGSAKVCGDAKVSKTNHVLVMGPVGSRSGYTTFFRDKDNEISVACGCFYGKISAFARKVDETHGYNKHGQAYRAAIELANVQIDVKQEDILL